jgi:hypothetical protein
MTAMAADAMVFANEALFNLLLSRYVSANPGALSGIQPVPLIDVEFVFSGNGAPTTDLAPQPDGGNIGIHVPLLLKVFSMRTNPHTLQKTVPINVRVSGTLALQGQTLGLTGLTATGEGGTLDARAAEMFNALVVPTISRAVASIPMPDLTKVIGVPVQVEDVEVVNRQVAVSARVAGGSGQLAITPTPFEDPAVTAAISGDAINALARAQFQPVVAPVGGPHTTAGFGYDAEAEAGADNPRVQIAGGQAEGTIDVWASAKAGVEVAGTWIRPSVNVSSRVPPLGLRLATDSSRANLNVKVYLNGTVHFDFGLPSELQKYADDILSVLGTLDDAITAKINDALSPISIRAFTLPSTVPGTNLSASLSFIDQRFAGDGAMAVVRVG